MVVPSVEGFSNTQHHIHVERIKIVNFWKDWINSDNKSFLLLHLYTWTVVQAHGLFKPSKTLL